MQLAGLEELLIGRISEAGARGESGMKITYLAFAGAVTGFSIALVGIILLADFLMSASHSKKKAGKSERFSGENDWRKNESNG